MSMAIATTRGYFDGGGELLGGDASAELGLGEGLGLGEEENSCATTTKEAAGDGGDGLDYRALIREQRRELEELKRAAREASPDSRC